MSRATVLVTGCFDLLTEAHLRLLSWAAELGDVTVGIDHETTVPLLGKGVNRPILDNAERTRMLRALPQVSDVIIFSGPGAASAIGSCRPTFWVKGGDYSMDDIREDERRAARASATEIRFAPRFSGPSTSDIIERIRGRGRATGEDSNA